MNETSHPTQRRTVAVERLSGEAVLEVLDAVARLRIAVFAAYPYLYDGDLDYERNYLKTYADSPGAVVVIARDSETGIVGASTAAPLGDHQPQLAASFRANGIDPSQVFYLGESVLLPDWRGLGLGHRFFDAREAAAREQGFSIASFCAVVRPEDHPARPADYQPLDAFWRKRGYDKVAGIEAPMRWRDIGASEETEKPMRFWLRTL